MFDLKKIGSHPFIFVIVVVNLIAMVRAAGYSSGCPLRNCENSLSNFQFVYDNFNFKPQLKWINKDIKGSTK